MDEGCDRARALANMRAAESMARLVERGLEALARWPERRTLLVDHGAERLRHQVRMLPAHVLPPARLDHVGRVP